MPIDARLAGKIHTLLFCDCFLACHDLDFAPHSTNINTMMRYTVTKNRAVTANSAKISYHFIWLLPLSYAR